MNEFGSQRRAMLAIDVGNTSIKLGQFDWPRHLPSAVGPESSLPLPRRVIRLAATEPDWEALGAWLAGPPEAIYLVSVCPPAAERLTAWLVKTYPGCPLSQLAWTDFPLQINVEYPERVGHDRLAAAVAARQLKRADRAAIIVDAGSAITVDLVSPEGAFLGGAIFPGWPSMARTLAVTTHFLPQIDTSEFPRAAPPDVVGRSTHAAIASGLYWGSVGAIRELIDRMSQLWQTPPDRFVAGGDMQAMLPYLGPGNRYVSELVLGGIALTAATLNDQPAGRRPAAAGGEVPGP